MLSKRTVYDLLPFFQKDAIHGAHLYTFFADNFIHVTYTVNHYLSPVYGARKMRMHSVNFFVSTVHYLPGLCFRGVYVSELKL